MTFRERLLAGELLVGCFLNTGSAVAAEICAHAGFDWLLFDLEHGSASEAHLLPQLQAAAASGVTALVRVEAIAAIDGVDCLFVGPSDLTHALGIFQQTEHELYVNALGAVREAAAGHGKATGVLVPGAAEAARYRELGFTLIAVGSDTSYLAGGARGAVAAGRG